MTCVAAFIALIFARFTSWSIGHGIENRFFYDSMEARNGMVYTSYVNEYNAYGGRVGPHAYVTLTNRNKSTKKIHGKYSEGNTVLVSFPELPNEFEPYHYSIYGTMCYEDNPNKLQIEYCMGGVKMSNKIRSLKMEYPSPKQVKMFQQWYQTYSSHTKIIAAVIEKKGDKHSFINATQSDDKLWAYEGTSPKIGQKVLVAYHVNNPNLYYVYNWSPTEEDYQFYNKKEGLSPFEKYKDLINEEITKNE